MSLTNTASAALSATVAENAAAEAKSYAIKASQAEDFSNQAQASADAAAESASSASDAAAGATTSESNAAAAAETATTAAQNATITANLYPSLDGDLGANAAIADGKIPDGAIFFVRSISNYSIADEYKNIGGVATATGKSTPATKFVKDLSILLDVTASKLQDNDKYYNGERIVVALTDSYGNSNTFNTESGALYIPGARYGTDLVASDQYLMKAEGDGTDGLSPYLRIFSNGHVICGLGNAPTPPLPVYHLNPPGIYLPDNITPNPDAGARVPMLKDLNDFNEGVCNMAIDCAYSKDYASGRAVAEWLLDWAMRSSMTRAMTTTGGAAFERHWRVPNWCMSYMISKGEINVMYRRQITDWFKSLGDQIVINIPTYPNNNHRYWAAASLYGIYAITGDSSYKDMALTEYDNAMNRINDNGTLTTELDRAGRILYYHSFALQPLIMICEISKQIGEDIYARDERLFKLIETVIHGMIDPAWFKSLVGTSYEQEPVTRAGWPPFVVRRFPDINNNRLPEESPIYTDIFFMYESEKLAKLWVEV